MTRILLFFLLGFLGFSGMVRPLWADVQVKASVDPSRATLEDEIVLTVTVKGTMQDVTPSLPSMPAFRVVPSGTSSNIEIINGTMSSSKEYTYILIPQNEGSFTIDPVIVSVGGRDYKTEPISVVISKSNRLITPPGGNALPSILQPLQPATPQPPLGTDNTESKESRDYWMTAEVSNRNPYLNEQILYTFRFYTRLRVSEASLTPPDFKDFVSEEVVPEKKYYRDIGGDRFVVSEKVIALFPLRAGKIELPETTLRIEVPDSRRSSFPNDPFFGFGGFVKSQTKNLRSDPISLEVKPLPMAPSADFTNLVGQFGLTADLSVNSLKVGDTATLTLTLSGTGNIQDAALPAHLIDLGGNFKIYSDKPALSKISSENGIQGSKVFKVALVPTGAGDTPIPEFTLSYFDPKKESYQTMKSPSFLLHVDPSGQESLNPVVGGSEPAKANVPLIAEDIATIHTDPLLLGASKREIKFLLILGTLIPFLFFVGVLVQRGRRQYRMKNEKAYQSRRALKVFRKGVGRLKSSQMKQGEFVSRLLNAIREFMGGRFGIYGRGLTAVDIGNLLEANGVDRKLSGAIRDLVIVLEEGIYGGGGDKKNPEVWLHQAQKLIPAIDKKAKGGGE